MPDPDSMTNLLKRLEGLPAAAQLQALQESARAHPGDARPLLLLAAHFAQQGEQQRAEDLYAAALVCAPGLAIARFQLGLLQFTNGRIAPAMLTWAPLDLLAPDDPLRIFRDAFARLAADDHEGAERLLVRGIAANTGNAALNGDMAAVLDRIRARRSATTSVTSSEAHFLVSAYKTSV